MNAKTDRIISLGLILFGVVGYVWVIPSYVDKPQAGLLDELPADLYPNIIMIAIVSLGIIQLAQSLIFSRSSEHQAPISSEKKRRAGIALSSLVMFLIAIYVVGYYAASAVFLAFTMRYLGERRVWIIGLTVVLYLAFNYLFFEKGLTVVLPRGMVASLIP